MHQTIDRNGSVISTGSKVKVLSIKPSVIARLSAKEAEEVQSLLGEVLEVYEIDEWGSAWVKKWWHADDGLSSSHSLALSPEQMELVNLPDR